jgi:NADPH-dependent glutamate synthase beta subunit-like oxidoreductase
MVHEALPVAGDVMAAGIPEYRLPHRILEYEVGAIRKQGASIVTNSAWDAISVWTICTTGPSLVAHSSADVCDRRRRSRFGR